MFLKVVFQVVLLLLSCAGLVLAETSKPAVPTASGVLQIGEQGQTIGVSLAPGGPLFALAPIARALGIEVRTGPLGDSLTLIFEDKKVVVGTEGSSMVSTDLEGGNPVVERLRQAPIQFGGQVRVPLDVLEGTIGEYLGYSISWNAESQILALEKRERKQVEASVTVVHQYGVSTVEIRFSDLPRYRSETLPGRLRIRMIGDELVLTSQPPPDSSPFFEGVDFNANFLDIRLADGARAATPRLLLAPPRLIIEVFEQAQPVKAQRSSGTGFSAPRKGLRTIVLDPGHGGAETGAIGSQGTAEKDLNLRIAQSLKRRLESRLAVSVVLTRDSDVELPLESRTAIANQNKADLFVSLHLNASYGKKAQGTETYFLSREASDQLAAEAAATENQYGASESPESDLKLILWDLAQSYHLSSSQRFANLVQEELNLALGLRNRGVKQAPFKVLMGAEMPAVLVELGFLSNPEEETKLLESSYRNDLVDALVRAVVRYKTQLEAGDISRDTAARP